VLESTQSNSALVIRCRDHATEAYISVRTYIGTSEALPIVYRIDDAPPIDTRWLASRDGSALFLANPTLALTFIRSLPVDGTLRVRVSDFQGRSDEFTYVLGPVDEIRTRIGSACNWPADQREPEPVAQQQAVVAPTAPAPARPQQPARRRSTIKVVSVPMHQQRWNISAQRR
jgi:hypothetical protein